DNYQFGNIIIDGQIHTKDVILLPDRVIGGWWRQEGHVLHLSDLDEVLSADLLELIIGLGAFNRMHVSPEVEEALPDLGIKLISLPTKEACQEYNRRSPGQECRCRAAPDLLIQASN
ncbi:MTH938/NDUFAF3 family protein, partial [Chloroflexota bacterium]